MRFIILGDLHYSDYFDPEHAAARDRVFAGFFNQVAALKADLIFAVGDTTNQGALTEMIGLEAMLKDRGLPLIRVTGNHDCYRLSKSELAPFFLGEHLSASATELYASFDLESVRFVLTDTAREKDNDNYGGYLSPEQLTWLAQEIKRFNQASHLNHLVVMGHHPIAATTRRSREKMLNIDNSEAVLQALAALEREPAFYFCGHNHNHSIYKQDDQPWYHVQTANPLDCQSFRLVSLDQNGVEIETIDFDLSESGLQADFETIRNNIPAGFSPQPFEAAYGEDCDRALSVQLPISCT